MHPHDVQSEGPLHPCNIFREASRIASEQPRAALIAHLFHCTGTWCLTQNMCLCVQAIKRMQQEPTEAELMIVSHSRLHRQGPCLCLVARMRTNGVSQLRARLLAG